MHLDGFLADAELGSDLLVHLPADDEIEHFPFARRERRQANREVVLGDLLLMAAEDFLPDFPNARVMLWGDGPGRKALQGLAKRLRLKRVSFPGPTRDPMQAYAAMDIFVNPARWEAGPYTVLEAMACGLPVVATDVAGNADYVLHDETGLLTPPELPGPIAGALHPLLADLDLRAAYGAAGRKRVESEFTLDRMLATTLAVYREVISERGMGE